MEKKEVIQVFLTSIEATERDEFRRIFLTALKSKINSLTSHQQDTINLQKLVAWGFQSSVKNEKLWNLIKKNDWLLFHFNGKYSFAAQIFTKKKSRSLYEKIFLTSKKPRPLLMFFRKVVEIDKGFQKTNNDLGISSAIPSIHKITLIQADKNSVEKIINKFGSVENYLKGQSEATLGQLITIKPSSMKKIPTKIKTTLIRRIRDTKKTAQLKLIYENRCQICDYSFPLNTFGGYSEVHHVWPLGDNGVDDFDNMLVLCPNHHAEFDYGVIKFNLKNRNEIVNSENKIIGKLSFKKGHSLNYKNIEFHNRRVEKLEIGS